MTEEIDAVIFDAGGTLIEMHPPRQNIISNVLAEHGHKIESTSVAKALVKADRTFDDDFGMCDGKEESWYWMKYDDLLFKELGIDGDGEMLMKAIHGRFHELLPKAESWVAYPDTKPVLKDLKKRDLKLGMVSNATDLLRRVLDSLELTQYFEFIIISEEVGVRKPSKKIFQLAINEAGTSPNRTVYVGDKLAVDVQGAKRAGMNAVLIDRDDAFPDAKCIRARDLNFFRTYF